MDSLAALVKPSTKEDLSMSEHTETKMPWTADSSIKSGEIFRNDKGEYSFMCFHCGFTFHDFSDTINHIDSHFDTNDVKWDIEIQPQELIFCAEIEPEITPSEMSLPDVNTKTVELPILNTSSNLDQQPEMSVRRRGRKRKPVVAISQYCPMCESWCDDFRGHLKTVHDFNGKVYQCFLCRQYFKTLLTLKNHISSRNHTKSKCYHCEMEPPITNPLDARRHKCLFCKEWFPNHIQFKMHFKDAHDKDADYFFHKRSNCNIFTCYVCEREFPLRYYLVGHMKTHHEKFLRHQCPTCGKRVRTYGQLTQHLKIHEGKTFQCDQCEKKFPYYAKLRLHLWTHKTELNYKCDVCSKAFKKRVYLRRHMAVHGNAKKYSCRFCEASFNFTSGRRAHEKGQHKAL